jgi:plasmid stabilization system protein ParE
MTLTWSPEAIDDLASLRAYISVDDPAAAKRIALHIIHGVEELLSNNSHLGHPGRVPGTRVREIRARRFIGFSGGVGSTQLKHDPGIVRCGRGRRFAGGDCILRIESPRRNAR